MLWQAMTAARDLGRLHEIASILIRHGFGDVVRRLGFAHALERAGRALHWSEATELAQLEPQASVRRAMEEMGPTFVKLGQILATRVDLFDPEWIAEFSKLQDSTPASPYSEVHQQLTEDLGAPPEEIFAAFEPEPFAAGSIAQVHLARLEDGTEVVVKVRRPGIRTVVEADLRWLSRLAELIETSNSELRHFHWQEVVAQFTQSLRRELDFGAECRHAERVASNFAGYSDEASPVLPLAHPPAGEDEFSSLLPLIVIPKVYWQWTGERVCVQEYIRGIPGRDVAAVDRAGLDRKVLARRGVGAVIKMILVDGLFHADPHPGNLFYLPGNRIAFIDFGMIGLLGEARRGELIHLLLGLVQYDSAAVADVLLDWTGEEDVNEEALKTEIQLFVDQYLGVPLKQLKLGSMLADLVAILRGHRLHLPPDLALFFKAFITLEGAGRELDPELDIAGEALPLLRDAMAIRYAPTAMAKRGWRTAIELASLLSNLPRDLSRLLRSARRGKVDIHIEVAHLKHVGDQLDGAVNRLVVGIVVAAVIVGSSVVMAVSTGPTLWGLPFFSLLGFACATIGAIWLLSAISRANKADRARKPRGD
jgi:ubiquinone biosynthesis protein